MEKEQCDLCDMGHDKNRGVHIPTQRNGMIPPTVCTAPTKDEVWSAMQDLGMVLKLKIRDERVLSDAEWGFKVVQAHLKRTGYG